MKLFTYCNACKKEIPVKSNADSRPELENERGQELALQCPECLAQNKKHVNDIRAKQNNVVVLGGVGVGIVITLILGYFLGALATLTFIVPIMIWQQQRKAVDTFNRVRVRRKNQN